MRSTRVVPVEEPLPVPRESYQFELPDAPGAQALQEDLSNAGRLGPWDRITNSCMTHCGKVAAAGLDCGCRGGTRSRWCPRVDRRKRRPAIRRYLGGVALQAGKSFRSAGSHATAIDDEVAAAGRLAGTDC